MNRKKYLKSADPEIMIRIEESMRLLKQMRNDGLIPTEIIPLDIRTRLSAGQIVKIAVILGTMHFIAKTADRTLETFFGERIESWLKGKKTRLAQLKEEAKKEAEEADAAQRPVPRAPRARKS